MRPMPAGHESPTAVQGDVLRVMNHRGPTHVTDIAIELGVNVDAIRQRLRALDRKHLVVIQPTEGPFANWFVLTGRGRAARELVLETEAAA